MTIDINTFLQAAFDLDDLKGNQVGLGVGMHSCRAYDPAGAVGLVGGDLPVYVVVSTLDGKRRVRKDGTVTRDLGRARDNCKEAWLFVLDDIGTKSRTPSVLPSYVMQTSVKDGVPNYQWGYFLEPFDVSTASGVAFYEGACRAAGEAGISDPGMRGVYRICRVPGSLHSSGFRAEVVEWNPDRVFKLEELVVKLGLDVSRAIKPVPRKVAEEDGVFADVVLDWLEASGRVTGVVNGDWMEVECPNCAAHTDGSATAGYSPLDFRREGRQFKCFHGHCADLDTGWFLSWVAENGGPLVGAYEAWAMTPEAREVIGRVIRPALPVETVEYMELMDERERILREWYLCEASGLFVHYVGVAPRRFVTTAVFNTIHAIHMAVGPKGGRMAADKWWAVQEGRQVVNDVVWRPDRASGVFTDEHGLQLLNAYVPYIPDGVVLDAAVCAMWETHLVRLFGEDAAILRQWMGWLVQHPEQRINWAPVLQGIEGCGKSLIGQALVGALGRQYVVEVGPSAFADVFNSWMEGKLLALGEEIRVSGQNRYAVMDTLKTLLTNDWIDVRGMHRARRTIQNTTSYMIFTNHDDALPLEYGNRRWAIFKAKIETAEGLAHAGMDADYFGRLADSIRQNPGAIFGWLASIDVSNFDPKGRAPGTEGTEEMIYDTTDELYRQVLNYILAGTHPDANSMAFTNRAVKGIVALLDRKNPGRALTSEGKWRSFLRSHGWSVMKTDIRDSMGEVTRVWLNTRKLKVEEMTVEAVRLCLEDGNRGVKTVSNLVSFPSKSGA